MVTNTPQFGRLFREARGPSTQDEIDHLGGPYRQRQTEIERGDPVDMTPALLTQIDTAFHWTTGSAQTLLTAPVAASEHRTEHATLSPRALGVDDSGREIAMPPKLRVDPRIDLTPLLRRWDGPILIDLTATNALQFRPPTPLEWLPRQTYRSGVDQPVEAEVVAIDPLAGLTSYRRALTLATDLPSFRLQVGAVPKISADQAALAMLFVAAEMHREGTDSLTALSRFAENARHRTDAFDLRWKEFHRSSGLSSRLAQPDFTAPELFQGLMAARDTHVEVVIDPDADEKVRASAPPTVPPTQLTGGVLFYDSSTAPELPLVIDWALGDDAPPRLLVTLLHPARAHTAQLRLPGTHQLLVDPYICRPNLGLAHADDAASWPELFKTDSIPKLGTPPNHPDPVYVPAQTTTEAGARTTRITLAATDAA